jgi:FkbM family methyltransferase
MESLRSALGKATYQAARALPTSVAERLQSYIARNRRAGRVARRLTDSMRDGVHRIARGPAEGLLMDVAGSRPSYVLGTAEPEVTSFLATNIRPNDVVFDLGANVGYFTLVAAQLVRPSGRVVAVEPLPSNVAALRRNVELNKLENVTVVEAAVSNSEGTASLALGDSDQSSSLILQRGATSIEVPTVTIDGLVRSLDVEPSLIKMDVEGAELGVIEGGANTLSTARPTVLCELHTDRPSFSLPVPSALDAMGYELCWIEPAAYEQEIFWAPHLVARRRAG